MSFAKQIKDVANKLKTNYSTIKLLVYSNYGNSNLNEVEKLNILKKVIYDKENEIKVD